MSLPSARRIFSSFRHHSQDLHRTFAALTAGWLLVAGLSCGSSGGDSPATTPPPAITFTASPGNIALGQSSTLTWSVTDATAVSIDNGIGEVTSDGTRIVTPSVTSTYTLVATGNGGTRLKTAQVTVTPAPPPAPENTLTLQEGEGETLVNHPIQIARPFLKGEIAHYPQALVDGVPVDTQADVKQRHSDGSVKHAILTFLVPTLTANGTVVVAFQDQPTGLNEERLTKAEMLDARYDFDAGIELTQGTALAASARQMLQEGKFTYWMEGPVATSIILADHSADRTHDLGFDVHRSFRPIFHATFWPGLNKVRVRFIGEICNTEALQDMTYSLKLSLGHNAPATVYAKSTFTHYHMNRWTKAFWIGGEPSRKVSINHNLDYLKEARFIYNYDTTKAIPASEIAARYSAWLNTDRDIYGEGTWKKYNPATGGRADLGPYPSWIVRWLYTGDWRAYEESAVNADLAGAWPLYLREGNPAKFFDTGRTVQALGRVLSIAARPTIFMRKGKLPWAGSNAEDNVTIVGPQDVLNGGWIYDAEHAVEPGSPLYILTGDYWYLEQMYFHASWGAAESNGSATIREYGRGPTGAEGGIVGAERSQGRVLRTRAHAAFIAPDDHPEKAYFEQRVKDALVMWEGAFNLDTENKGSAMWNWGRNVYASPWGGVPPLRHWFSGSSLYVKHALDPNLVQTATAPWGEHIVLYALGRTEELGYPASAVKRFFGKRATDILSQSGEPYLIGTDFLPCKRKSDQQYMTTWTDVLGGYLKDGEGHIVGYPSYDPNHPIQSHRDFFEATRADEEHGYANIAMAATSFVTDLPNGEASWQWIKVRTLDWNPDFNTNPKWAIVPR